MLKIVTDPTEGWPLLEADLSQSEGKLAVNPKVDLQSRDLRFTNPTGGTNVILRERRARYVIPIDWIDYAKYQDLLHIVARRVPIYLFPNFDGSTLIDAPLTTAPIDGNPRYWKRDPTTQLPTKTASTFSRSTMLPWEIDAGGRFQQVGVGVPRFMPGPFGRGIVLENGLVNLAPNTHPTSGSLGWVAGAAPALAPVWEPGILSPVTSKLGCARLPYDAHASLSATWNQAYATGQSAAGKFRAFSLWLAGDAEVLVSASINSTDTDIVTVPLTMRKFTEIPLRISPKVTTGNSVSITLIVLPPDSAGNIYAGPFMDTDGLQSNDDMPPPAMWNEAGTSVEDDLTMSCPLDGGTYSIAWMGLVPQRIGSSSNPTSCRCWGIDGDGSFPLTPIPRAEFEASGTSQILKAWLNSAETIQVTVPSSVAGAPFYASLVVDYAKADPTARLYFRSGSTIVTAAQEGRSDFIGARMNGSTMEIGNSDNTNGDYWPGRRALSHIRVDQRAWSVAEQDLHARLYIEDSFRTLLATTLGRRFWISDMNLNPREDRWDDIVGSITVDELDTDPDLQVVGT